MFSKQDIVTSIKNTHIFLKSADLKGATFKLNTNGSPYTHVGGFNMVFKLNHNQKDWAFRVWHVPMGNQVERYKKIANYLKSKNLPYFSEFIYDEKSLLVNGQLLDTTRTAWVEGKLLKQYLEENLYNPSKLRELASKLLTMFKTLRRNKISHGDLQEGNILIDENENIKLLDYDSICIPEVVGQSELVTGLKGYQHPSRFNTREASLKSDFFSELIIYTSILALAEKPQLWKEYQVKETNYLLFTETDFQDFKNSNIYNSLLKLSPIVKELIDIVSEYLQEENYNLLLPFDNLTDVISEKISKYSYVAKDKEDLIRIIEETIDKHGNTANLNFIDTSKITDMSSLFKERDFNGDISQWDVSNVTDMSAMFGWSEFNGDISQWNVSNVSNMSTMFSKSQFNGDISKWNVSNVTDMSWMFYGSQFNGDISQWDVSNVTNMSWMFKYSKFYGDISKWNVKISKPESIFENSYLQSKTELWPKKWISFWRFFK